MCLLLCAGNDILHLLTSDKRQRLRVDLADFEGNTRYAEYDNFRVDSVQAKYKLASLGTYTGNAGIGLVTDLFYCDLLQCCVMMPCHRGRRWRPLIDGEQSVLCSLQP